MKKSIGMLVLGALMMLGLPVAAAAQNVSIGYQWQHAGEDENMPLGINLDAAFPLGSGALSGVGQLDWSRKSQDDITDNLTFFGGGVRWSGTAPSVTPFVHVLLGVAHMSSSFEGLSLSDNEFAMQLGGGVAKPITPMISVVGQVDWRPIFTDDETTNSFRIVGGIRIKL